MNKCTNELSELLNLQTDCMHALLSTYMDPHAGPRPKKYRFPGLWDACQSQMWPSQSAHVSYKSELCSYTLEVSFNVVDTIHLPSIRTKIFETFSRKLNNQLNKLNFRTRKKARPFTYKIAVPTRDLKTFNGKFWIFNCKIELSSSNCYFQRQTLNLTWNLQRREETTRKSLA